MFSAYVLQRLSKINVHCGVHNRHLFHLYFLFLKHFPSSLPVRWESTVIVVLNEVRVNSPYKPENVSGGAGAANERVKKVV